MTSVAPPVLVLDGVSLWLADRCLVPCFDAALGPGAVLAVTGPSGAGKSSLLAWIAGLLTPPFAATGAVKIDGVDVTDWPTERRRIGLVFQDDLLFPHLSVRDNLLFAVPAAPRSAREAEVATALAAAGLDGYGARRPSQLSGGQRSRVALLRALLAQPRVLLLDEPYAKLDRTLRRQMRDWVQTQLSARGVPAVLVTHDADDVPAGAVTLALPDTDPAA